MSNELEELLKRDLRKVEAPVELRERVESALRRAGNPITWTFATALPLAVVAVFLGVRSHESPAANASVSEPTQARAWVKSRTGLDLELADPLPPSVRLVSVRVVDPAAPSVEVTYQSGGRTGTLLVARASGVSTSRHADLRNVSADSKIAWVAHGQSYTLTTASPPSRPDDARAACLLCHAS